ncbi:MAG: hypothetical protein R3E96_03695 [Planctomycetota bacterium]
MINSTGNPVVVSGLVSPVGSGLHLDAVGGPIGDFRYFLVGDTANASNPVVLGDGLLCLDVAGGGILGRYNVVGGALNSIGVFDGDGRLVNAAGTSLAGVGYDVPAVLPLPGSPAITAGSTWHFQLWYRDSGAGAGHSNLSNGLSVGF